MHIDRAVQLRKEIEEKFLSPASYSISDEYLTGIRKVSLQEDNITGALYMWLNGVSILKDRDSNRCQLKLYLEEPLPNAAIAKHFSINTDDLITNVTGPITILGRGLPNPGDSIGHYKVSAGTLGCYVRDIHSGKPHILSNNHVLANINRGRRGDPIICPGRKDGGNDREHVVARLNRFVPIDFKQGMNRVDCAMAELLDWDQERLKQESTVLLTRVTSAKAFMAVRKTGRTTGVSHGRVIGTDTTVKVDYGGTFFYKNRATFTHQIEVEGTEAGNSFSDIGDSGSLLIDNQSGAATGLIFAGAASGITFANHIDEVLTSLSADIL